MVAILVLAAGASKRLGQPKQLLTYKDTTLLGFTVQKCLESKIGKVYVVLGAHANKVKSCTVGLECSVVVNKEWENGISSSISCGIKSILEKESKLSGVIIVLGDQPFLSKGILKKFGHETEKDKCKNSSPLNIKLVRVHQFCSILLCLENWIYCG